MGVATSLGRVNNAARMGFAYSGNATKMGKDGSLPAHVQRFDRIITKDLVFQMMPISDVESGRIKKLVAPFSGT